MKTFAITRRLAMVAGSAALLGACSIIPRGADVPSRPIENAPAVVSRGSMTEGLHSSNNPALDRNHAVCGFEDLSRQLVQI